MLMATIEPSALLTGPIDLVDGLGAPSSRSLVGQEFGGEALQPSDYSAVLGVQLRPPAVESKAHESIIELQGPKTSALVIPEVSPRDG